MDNEIEPTEETGRHVSRRTVIKGVGIGTAAIWVAPAVTSLGTKAFAVSSTNPHPECIGSTCANFIVCSSALPSCICTTTAQGGGFCVDGNTSCADGSGPCDANNNCPSGQLCLVGTCCGTPVCIPESDGNSCPPDTTSSTKKSTAKFKAGSIGGG